jgi:AcrR family transcriptional regulator
MTSRRVTGTRPSPKERTRRLLVDTARELLRTGAPLTVQALAEHAGVSRATAYRYFPSNEAVVLHATMPLVEDAGQRLEPPDPTIAAGSPVQDLPAKAGDLVRAMGRWAFDHENELRTLLRLSLAPEHAGAFRRGGRTNRDSWIATVLDDLPAHVPQAARDRLATALVPLFGADAVVWSTDIAQVDQDTALDVMAWMAATLVQATLDDNL